ncbi:hypothetical protein [Saccharopolyspora indica]|uniref:hypothetical protein n=1 Tax=Saccharopolyspora indica TaxID=1229659 RepID=UPI002FDC4F6E
MRVGYWYFFHRDRIVVGHYPFGLLTYVVSPLTLPLPLPLKMWLFPWLSYLTIALMLVVIAAMAVLPGTRSQFWLSLVTLAVVLTGYESRRRGTTNPTGGVDRP